MESAAPRNLLLEKVEYLVQETPGGVWRRFMYPNGMRFAEYKSHAELAGMPLVHYTYGICPETGERIRARGVVAIGRTARGVVAIGQMAFGVVAIGQLAFGIVIGIGQVATGVICIGQVALGLLLGFGQFATGYIAIGQGAVGHYVLAQSGRGTHVIDMVNVDPVAKKFFLGLIGK